MLPVGAPPVCEHRLPAIFPIHWSVHPIDSATHIVEPHTLAGVALPIQHNFILAHQPPRAREAVGDDHQWGVQGMHRVDVSDPGHGVEVPVPQLHNRTLECAAERGGHIRFARVSQVVCNRDKQSSCRTPPTPIEITPM